MSNANPLITPVVALVGWSLLMWIWMYATRLPAVRRARMKLDPNAARGAQMSELPPNVRWKADNYTHLMEQPTIYYAIVLALVALGDSSGVTLALAWSYVVLRVLHSLLQSMINIIEVRFALFVLSTVPLFGLVWRAAAQVSFGQAP